ncbi:MAG: serine hydrolase domain-containing protein [Burkholderiaceae bacterium]
MDKQIVARLRHSLDTHQLPGLAVVIRQNSQVSFAGGVGCFDSAQLCHATENTQYGVASLSKFVTTGLLMRLHERKALSIDDLLVQYFPTLRVAQQAPITLAHLMGHSSGLPGLPGRFYARNLDDSHDRSGGIGTRGQGNHGVPALGLPDLPTIVSPPELVDLMNQLELNLLAPPGELLNYSNEGFCLLGGVIEQVTQRAYPDVVHEEIFAPLQMTQSSIGESVAPPESALALPLLRDGARYHTGRFWRAPLFYPAGGCISSARDIARLIGSLSDDLAAPSSFLSPKSKQRMIHLQMPVASRPAPTIGYGLGLEVQQLDTDTTMLWHSGQRAGVSSFMACLLQQHLAISVLCNVADAPVTTIGHELIGEVLGRPEICWPPAALAQESCEATANLEGMVGSYASLEGNRYTVEQSDHGLMLTSQGPQQALPLHFAGADYGTVGMQTFRFLHTRPTSPARSLALDLRVLERVA